MRQALLEARVFEAIEARRSGITAEDDLTECKAAWPEPKAARQLAGLANRAAGQPIIWIVGFDDRTGTTRDPGPTDPADWWAQMQSQFDGTPPYLANQARVSVGNGEYVQAFGFETNSAPYVVKNATGGHPEREVPMRDGTRTRSAFRHELLRLLLPTVAVPHVLLLQATVWASWEKRGLDERTSLRGEVQCFFEHLSADYSMLPAHGMRGLIRCAWWEGRGTVRRRGVPLVGDRSLVAPQPPASRHGVEARDDGLLLTGPGAASLQVFIDLPISEAGRFAMEDSIELGLDFEVTGTERHATIVETLVRSDLDSEGSDSHKTLGRFVLGVPY